MAIQLTIDDIDDLADGHTINVPAGPHDQEIIVYGEDFEPWHIDRLYEGGVVTIDGFDFQAELPARARGAR